MEKLRTALEERIRSDPAFERMRRLRIEREL
jgi:hypothetical protein